MKKALSLLLGLGLVLAFVVNVAADEAKVIKGKLVCGKCTLAETDKCSHVVKAKEKGKEVKYYLVDKGAKEKYHKGVCPPNSEKDVEVTVKGKIEEKEGKKYVTPEKVEVK